MADVNPDLAHPPMILPAGGYELDDLEKAAAAVMKAKPEARDRVMGEQIAKVRKADYDKDTAGALPGHVFREEERVLVEGVEQPVVGGKKGETELIGEVKVVERIQVFDPAKGEEEVQAADEATVAGERAGAGSAPAGESTSG